MSRRRPRGLRSCIASNGVQPTLAAYNSCRDISLVRRRALRRSMRTQTRPWDAPGAKEPSAHSHPITRIVTAVLKAVSTDSFLVVLPATALVLGVLWAGMIPLWQIPDEHAHFGYVQSLGEGRTFVPERYLSREISLTYELSRLNSVAFDNTATQPFVPGSAWGPAERQILSLPASLRDEIHPDWYNRATSYPPGYYFLASLVYRALGSQDILTIMFGLRIFSAILTSITVLFNYLTLRLFFDRRALARAAGFLIALSPMYIFMGMAVNVDVLVSLLFSIYIYLLTRALQRGLSQSMNIALASTVGVGLWVKQTFLIAAVFYFVLLIFERLRRSIVWPMLLRFALVFSGVVFLMVGWVYLSGLITTSPTAPSRGFNLAGFLGHFFENWRHYRWALQETFWGSFGWLDTPLSHTMYAVVGFVSLGAIAGFLTYLASGRGRRQPRAEAIFFLLLIVIFGGAMSFLNYREIASGRGWFLQGRYFFPIMAPIFAVLVTGLTWFASSRWQQAILFGAVGGIVVFHTVAVFNYVLPRYYL